jgi:predicted AAA+ superfamily ATPase
MNCEERNHLLALGEIDREDLWPKVTEFENARYQFRWEFGLDELPDAPGLIVVRGARQTGKSTWLELQLLETVNTYGKASGYILNGDEIYSHAELEEKLLELENAFSTEAGVKRIFIDELTRIQEWERVLKRLVDRGKLRDVLLITTGSNAFDLRRGSEKLPGRKGFLERSDYIFLPISYREYRYQTRQEIGRFPADVLWGYVLSGGSPLAINHLGYDDSLYERHHALLKDWIVGDIVESGRGRTFLLSLLRRLYLHGAGRISYTKLAQEAGLANNSAALDYVEKLVDLCCVLPCMQWDAGKEVFLARKPSKIHFINLAAALAFHPRKISYIHEVKNLEGQERAAIHEWIVAQELWRRYNLKNQLQNIEYGPVETFGYWASKEHEIDFVTPDQKLFEVKAGKASALEFSWFSKVFPQSSLTVVCESEFSSPSVRGVTLESFLYSAETGLYYDEDREQPLVS